MSLIYHPDKGGQPECFRYIKEVVDILLDPEKRALYDRLGKAAFEKDNAPCDIIHNVPTPPINKAFVEKLMQLQGSQDTIVGGKPLYDHFEHLMPMLKGKTSPMLPVVNSDNSVKLMSPTQATPS